MVLELYWGWSWDVIALYRLKERRFCQILISKPLHPVTEHALSMVPKGIHWFLSRLVEDILRNHKTLERGGGERKVAGNHK